MKKILGVLITLLTFSFFPGTASAAGYGIPNYASCTDPALLSLGKRICFDETTPAGPRAWVFEDPNNPAWYSIFVPFGLMYSPGINGSFVDPHPSTGIDYLIDNNNKLHVVYSVSAVSPEMYLGNNKSVQLVKTPTLYNCSTGSTSMGNYCAFSSLHYWGILDQVAKDPATKFVFLK